MSLSPWLGLALSGADGEVVQNPFYDPAPAPIEIDVRTWTPPPSMDSGVRFEHLDAYRREVSEPEHVPPPALPAGLTQIGGAVVPEAVAEGATMVPDARLGAATPGAGAPKDQCTFPDATPGGVYAGDKRPGGEVPRRHTIYLNFTGGTLQGGDENSAENLSTIARTGHPYPVYGGGETKAVAVAQAVAADFEQFSVRVVYLERPRKIIPYTMVMIGGHHSDTTAGPSGGVAPLDCEDFGQRNVCYAFQNSQPATSQANVVSQEIGHTMGLGHTQGGDRIMGAGYVPSTSADKIFGQECTPIVQVQGQSAACIGVNKCHCGDAAQQHDALTLGMAFAPAHTMDVTPPTIQIVEP